MRVLVWRGGWRAEEWPDGWRLYQHGALMLERADLVQVAARLLDEQVDPVEDLIED